MQQHHRRPLAADPDMDRRAVGGDLLRLERGREVRNLSGRRTGEGEHSKRQGNFQHRPSPAGREGGLMTVAVSPVGMTQRSILPSFGLASHRRN